MHYYDDILNVYAYMQSRTKENLLVSKSIIDGEQRLDKAVSELNQQADGLLGQVSGLAREMGIDISDITAENKEILYAAGTDLEVQDSQLQIHLPADFDYQEEFQRLCEEAHRAGFTDAHPEELLSAEEMRKAEAVDRELDIRFAESTGLREKDMLVLAIAVMIHSICFFVGRKTNGFRKVQESHYTGAMNIGTIRSYQQILQEKIPFDVADNAQFCRKDIAGFDKCLGWLVGVLNILTNTVTTYRLKSYSVIQPQEFRVQPCIDREISTLSGVAMPVLQNAAFEKNAVIAAVIQEARALGYYKADSGGISALFQMAVELEEKKNAVWNKTQSVLENLRPDWDEKIDGMEIISGINTIVAAVHAVLYDKCDGSIDMYAVRTNKIITYSNAMSTVINSLPAIAEQDISSLDFAGIILTCLGFFHSTRFWIEVKTNFLVSEYKKEIDREMKKIDRYFIFE